MKQHLLMFLCCYYRASLIPNWSWNGIESSYLFYDFETGLKIECPILSFLERLSRSFIVKAYCFIFYFSLLLFFQNNGPLADGRYMTRTFSKLADSNCSYEPTLIFSYIVTHRHTPSYPVTHRHIPSHPVTHRHIPSSIVIHRHTSSFIVIHRHTSSHTLIYVPSNTIIHRHTPSHTVIHCYIPSYTVIHCHTIASCINESLSRIWLQLRLLINALPQML